MLPNTMRSPYWVIILLFIFFAPIALRAEDPFPDNKEQFDLLLSGLVANDWRMESKVEHTDDGKTVLYVKLTNISKSQQWIRTGNLLLKGYKVDVFIRGQKAKLVKNWDFAIPPTGNIAIVKPEKSYTHKFILSDVFSMDENGPCMVRVQAPLRKDVKNKKQAL